MRNCANGMMGTAPQGGGTPLRGLTHHLLSQEGGLAMKATRICSIPGCDRPEHGRGLCNTHYVAARREGTIPARSRDAVGHPADAVVIDGFPYYSVDRDGNVWSIKGGTPRALRLRQVPAGYLTVTINHGSRQQNFRVHRLVARAFLGEPAPDQEVRHLDGTRTNNRVSNLAWGTRVENAADRERHGTTVRGRKHHSARFTPEQIGDVRRRHAAGMSQSALAREYGVSSTAIRQIVMERVWIGASLES